MTHIGLMKEDRQSVRHSLTLFTKTRSIDDIVSLCITVRICRDLSGLVGALCDVLDDPKKHVLYHYICQLLPEEIQGEFDQLASTVVANGRLVLHSILLFFSLSYYLQ